MYHLPGYAAERTTLMVSREIRWFFDGDAPGDRDPLTFNPDGSLDILIQHRQPETKVSNWLPAPAGNFAVTLRLYLPRAEFLEGTWKLPPIERLS